MSSFLHYITYSTVPTRYTTVPGRVKVDEHPWMPQRSSIAHSNPSFYFYRWHFVDELASRTQRLFVSHQSTTDDIRGHERSLCPSKGQAQNQGLGVRPHLRPFSWVSWQAPLYEWSSKVAEQSEWDLCTWRFLVTPWASDFPLFSCGLMDFGGLTIIAPKRQVYVHLKNLLFTCKEWVRDNYTR